MTALCFIEAIGITPVCVGGLPGSRARASRFAVYAVCGLFPHRRLISAPTSTRLRNTPACCRARCILASFSADLARRRPVLAARSILGAADHPDPATTIYYASGVAAPSHAVVKALVVLVVEHP